VSVEYNACATFLFISLPRTPSIIIREDDDDIGLKGKSVALNSEKQDVEWLQTSQSIIKTMDSSGGTHCDRDDAGIEEMWAIINQSKCGKEDFQVIRGHEKA